MTGLATSLIVAATILARATPQTPPPQPPTTALAVTVVATPLPGEKVPIGLIPAPVQVVSGADVERIAALDLSAFLARRANGIYLNEVQGNPLQADLNYRGYTASPLLGTPQGLSVYMDGVRLNQPFGDVVSWDLIPRIAISTATLMPGSNPVFGLNTLGGSIALQTKTGLAARGTTVQGTYGSDARRVLEFEHGGHARPSPLHWYLAGSVFDEAGWRADSPSDVEPGLRQTRVAARRPRGHRLGGARRHIADRQRPAGGWRCSRAIAPVSTPSPIRRRTARRWSASTTRHRRNARTFMEGAAYYRHLRTATLNGDINEESLDQALYQPSAAERAALAAAGYGSIPASGPDASNTPFPSLRCIANVLVGDEPAEKCNGLINRGDSRQQSGGASAQLSRRDAWRSRDNRVHDRRRDRSQRRELPPVHRARAISTPIAA